MDNFHYLLNLCLTVIKDWRVIAVTVFVVLYIALANYVVKYKKRRRVYKTKKSAPAPAKPAAPASGDAAKAEDGK